MKILVVAPHPDDESLGCGGTLLRMRAEQSDAELHWMLVTEMSAGKRYAPEKIATRNAEIESVAQQLGAAAVHRLGFPPAELDTVPLSRLIDAIGNVVSEVRPHTLIMPYRYDAHSDHKAVFDAVAACTKSFRYPWIKRVAAYETVSETEFGIDPGAPAFRPNVWVDISAYIDAKLRLIACYASELGEFPFPRSREAITALARLRGSTVGVAAAEGFVLLKAIL